MSESYHITSVVAKIGQLHFEGNIVPHSWYQSPLLQNDKGKPNLVAITLLADIVYWYRPTILRDEVTGQEIGRRQKFAADKLQKHYAKWGEVFGLTSRQVEDAMAFLKAKKLVTVEVRAVTNEYGTYPNCAFIEPIFEAIREMTFPSPGKTGDRTRKNAVSTKKRCQSPGKPGVAGRKNGTKAPENRDHSESPSETGTENSTQSQQQQEAAHRPKPSQQVKANVVVGDEKFKEKEDEARRAERGAAPEPDPNLQDALVQELIAEGMGEKQAHSAARDRYDVAVEQLANLRHALPTEAIKPSRGGWLYLAIKDGYDPTKGHEKWLRAEKARLARTASSGRAKPESAKRQSDAPAAQPLSPDQIAALLQQARNCVHPDFRALGEAKCERMVAQNYNRLRAGDQLEEHGAWPEPEAVVEDEGNEDPDADGLDDDPFVDE